MAASPYNTEDRAANGRTRATSQSTDGGIAPSIFSEAESYTTASSSPPHTSISDEQGEDKDKELTFEANTDDDLEEISKETFEANVYGTNQDNPQHEDGKVINGSTLGGTDPLHLMVRSTAFEPCYWILDRQHELRRNKTLKRKRSSNYTPSYFESLPYSPQDMISSGLCADDDPEENGEEFWEKVSKAWKLSCRYETVEDRRMQFEYDVFDAKSPASLSPSRFNDELSVV